MGRDLKSWDINSADRGKAAYSRLAGGNLVQATVLADATGRTVSAGI